VRLFIIAILLAGCARTEPESAEELSSVEGPLAQESWDITFSISQQGVIRMVLEAAHMVRYDDPDSLYTVFERGDAPADRVRATFYDSTGVQTTNLTAESVLFDEKDHTMIARGDVVLESEQGRKLESEYVEWNEDARTIEAPDFVSLTTENQHIMGYELIANEDLSTWSIKRPTGTVLIREPS